MNYANNTGYKRTFLLLFGIAAMLILAGVIISYNSTNNLFYKGLNTLRNISFKNTSFSATFIRAIKNHAFYCLLLLVLAYGFPGILIAGGYLSLKAFFLGTAVGLAAKGCNPGKAIGICLGVFWSNIFIFPLYLLAFVISLYRICAKDTRNLSKGNLSEGYWSFAAKITVIFALMCTAECVQTAIGTAILNRLYQ